MSNSIRRAPSLKLAGAAASALLAGSLLMAEIPNTWSPVGQAVAAEAGKGQGGPAAGHGKSGAARGKAALSAIGGSGGTGGSGSTVSGSKLGRLNMARAFVSPGFDISKIDDPLAPIAQVALYKETLSGDATAESIEIAGVALGNAATVNPVTLETVTKVNEILGITTTWTTDQLTSIATIATETLVARRTEESSTESTTKK